MVAKSSIISLAVVAAAGPVVSAPVPLSLPAGADGDLVKSLGKGILSGSAVTGLFSLFGPAANASSNTARDLEERGIATALEKLVGDGAESLESVLKKAVLGGAASGIAASAVEGAAGQNNKRGISSIFNIIAKLFDSSISKRGLADLSDEEVNTLLEYINDMNGGSNSRRALSSSLGKGLAGAVAGLAASQGASAVFDESEKLFKRELSLNELD
ncbi:hypothetical protein C8R45DRAFT_929485 [Mycena sanguinolenta]|nr:hypothetical protein C8R45DRAFT_929485 [Mycena sanguinolenta]